MSKYKKFFNDILLNIIGNLLVLGFIQLIIFPYISSKVSEENFGIIIIIYGIVNIYVSSFGNSLNNIRLLDIKGSDSDYNYLICIICSLLIPVILLLSYIYSVDSKTSVTLLLFSLLSILRAYGLVFYRIIVNYKQIMYSNLLLVLGYIIGLPLIKLGFSWPIVFILGELMCVIYVYCTTRLLKNGIKKTFNFKKITKRFSQLSFSALLLNVFNYLDRFLILPLIGSKEVALYYIASTIPKILLLLVTPTTNVMLTYINRFTQSRKKIFNLSTICCLVLLIIGYSVTVLISPLILSILYPDFLNDVSHLISVITLGIMLSIVSYILNPFILKYCNIKYQSKIALMYGLVYLIFSIILSIKFGLYGFCIAAIIANLFKCILLVIIGNKKIHD